MRFRSVALTILTILTILTTTSWAGVLAAQTAVSSRDLVEASPQTMEEALYDHFVQSVREGTEGTGDGLLRAVTADALRLEEPRTEAMIGPAFFCLPSCAANDGRFLALAPNGPGLDTLSDEDLDFQLAVDGSASSFVVGFFDGDTGGANWDFSTGQLQFTLFADPQADGSGTQVVATFDGSTMPNNAWADFTVPTGPEAQAPSGNYFYRLQADLINAGSPLTLSAFKIRTTSTVTIEVFQQPIGFIAQIATLSDAQIIYPSFPSLTPTTYDGLFPFFLDLPAPQDELVLWDGDMDRGSFDLTSLDTDDPNTSNTVKPPWAVNNPSAKFEGVALGAGGIAGIGSPPDNRNPAGLGAFLQKTVPVRYDVVLPDGQAIPNDNPSGNGEWERFKVTTGPFDPLEHDVAVAALPTGPYQVRIEGLDMQNLNAFFFFRPILCVDESGGPCIDPPRPFLVGDTVFLDSNGNGLQDGGEPGVAGVVVNLLDSDGNFVRSTVTDANGEYLFEVEGREVVEGIVVDDGLYTVQLDPSNFAPGGVLEGFAITTAGDVGTGGAEQTDQVIDDNVLTYDFGVQATGELGDRVWNDANGNGLQDAGEVGINGVTVSLFDSAGNLVATAVTAGDGNYLFENLPPDDYVVVVDANTLPAGFEPTADLDGLATPDQAIAPLGAGQKRFDVDFGYSICGDCAGKVTRLTLRYDGVLLAEISVVARRGPSTDEVFVGLLSPGDSFEVVGPPVGNQGFLDTLGTEIRLFVDGVENTTIHTSCSQPIGPGLMSGDFTVLAGASRLGGPLCPLEGGGGGGGGGDPEDEGVTGTVGFWKNHPEAWPVTSLTIGGVIMSQVELLNALDSPVRGSTLVALVKQLIAAKLNVAAGAEASCITDTLAAADAWVAELDAGNHPSKQEGRSLAETLDAYNNGELCAPHRG